LSLFALPVVAVERFHAGELEMGVLAACGTAAFLVVGLPAGAWVDRMDRRSVLVVADLVRALALAALVLGLAFDIGSMAPLYAVALVVGVAATFFDIAYQSVLPELVDPQDLVTGNARLQMSQSIAQVVGPGLGGLLVRLVGAPLVVLLDAASFLASAIFVARLPARTDEGIPDGPRTSIVRDIADGIRFVLRQALLLRIIACTALFNLAWAMQMALFVLFVLRDLGLGVTTLGFVYAVGAVGGLVGAVLAERLAAWIGAGRLIPLSVVAAPLSMSLYPLAAHLPVPTFATLVVAQWSAVISVVVYNVTQVSFRQRLCPPRMLGRMNATIRFCVTGIIPIGSLLGGVLGAAIGIEATLWVVVGIGVLAVVPVLLSPLRTMRDLPSVPADV